MMKRFALTHKLFLVAGAVLILGSAVLSSHRTHATVLPNVNDMLNANKGLLLYTTGDGNNVSVGSLESSAVSSLVSDFGNGTTQNDSKELYLSPNRKLIAITFAPIGEEVGPSTYISDINGAQITSAYSGRFVSWAPDSSKVLLYLSPMDGPWIRRIYALDVQGKYYDTGLPNGTINADISPIDGRIVYSLTGGGTDNSTLYIRDKQGNDNLVLKGDNNVFTWVRWSPMGDKIAFLKSDIRITSGQESVWTMNSDGTAQGKAADVVWNYPPVWSPDGTKIAFSNAGNIWEYDPSVKSLKNVTNLEQGGAQHPSYTADGKTIVFSSGASGEQQIWAVQDGGVVQLTTDNQEKDYPILP